MAGGRAGVAHLRGPRLLNTAVKLSAADLKAALKREAETLGFDCIGVTDPDAIGNAGKYFREFLDAGAHGDMDWLAAQPERRMDPRVLWPGVRSIIMLGVNMGPRKIRSRFWRSAPAARSPHTRRATTIMTSSRNA